MALPRFRRSWCWPNARKVLLRTSRLRSQLREPLIARLRRLKRVVQSGRRARAGIGGGPMRKLLLLILAAALIGCGRNRRDNPSGEPPEVHPGGPHVTARSSSQRSSSSSSSSRSAAAAFATTATAPPTTRTVPKTRHASAASTATWVLPISHPTLRAVGKLSLSMSALRIDSTSNGHVQRTDWNSTKPMAGRGLLEWPHVTARWSEPAPRLFRIHHSKV